MVKIISLDVKQLKNVIYPFNIIDFYLKKEINLR